MIWSWSSRLPKGGDPDPTPRGGIPGPCPPTDCLCPPNENCASPKRGLCPEEITRLGTSGAQIEVQISVFCGLTPDFVTLLGWRPFFWRSPVIGQKNRLNFRFWYENPLQFQWRPFFFEITCFQPEKSLEFPISAEKYLWLFAPHLVYFIQTGIKFSCPCATLEFTQNKLLMSPKNLFMPPSHDILAPGLWWSCPSLPLGWHCCPNPNCNSRFLSRKKIAPCIFFPVPSYCVYTPYSSIPRICNPSVNRTWVRWLEGEHHNHYTTQLATIQWQNVVFKPNVWEKRQWLRAWVLHD